MAVRGAICGWELPGIDVTFNFSGLSQDVWDVVSSVAGQPNTIRAHSGSNSVLLETGNALHLVTGQIEAFSGSAVKRRWTGFHSPKSFTNPAAGDEVFICQLCIFASAADRKHLAVVGLTSAPGGVNKFQYALAIITVTSGTIVINRVITDATAIDPTAVGNSDWYMWTVEYNNSVGDYGSLELYVGLNSTATLVGSHLLLSGEKSGLALDAYLCPDTRTAAGKGASILNAYFDDHFASDDQDGGLTIRPTFDIGIVRATICADTAEDDWTGNPDTADKFKNWNDDDLTDYNDPTSTTNHRQVSDVEEIDTGTVYGMRVVFAAGGGINIHDIRAGLSSSFRTYSGVGYGDSAGGSTNWCGRGFAQTPEASPQAWTTVLFNTLGAGLEARTTTRDIGALWVNVIGDNLVLAGCPVGATRRIFIT